ncbi:MAG: DNA polymerase domain-containing protein [Anaerolineales bacterium]
MPSANEILGWLLDIYPDPEQGVVLWLLDQDGTRRHRLHQAFPTTFYVHGPGPALRALWRHLQSLPLPPQLSRTERQDLFVDQPLAVLQIVTRTPLEQEKLFSHLKQAFPDLAYYDADIPIDLRYAAQTGVFPLARCRVQASEDGEIQALETLDSPWGIDAPPVPLQVMSLVPDANPDHEEPTSIKVHLKSKAYSFPFQDERGLLVKLRALLLRHDPDLLLTVWGDNWLIDKLYQLMDKHHISLPLNRESSRQVERRAERYYHSYGGVIYRGPQARLFGRIHISTENTVMYHDYGLEGVFEMARVTSLRIQTAARVSPGTGISSMQILTALRQGVLVPWHKQQVEWSKSAYNLLQADRGGMVYQPTIGLHANVAEIDFISMYPSIMEHFNISPETIGKSSQNSTFVPELELTIDQGQRGLVPDTLQPLLEKRIRIKEALAGMSPRDARYRLYKAQSSAHKWLLVTCFGYLGYKNARFGRIEAHEAVTAYGREALLRAKEAAEELGFRVLHMYVDGLWVQKEDAVAIADFQPLLEKILDRTGLPISLEGIYHWIAFLSSRPDPRVPVANRYFGLFQNGTWKVRGIELRRSDTPKWVKRVQREILDLLGEAPQAGELIGKLPGVHALLQTRLEELREGKIPLPELLVSQKLSRPLDEYRVPSPAARAAAQLAEIGKHLTPGQHVRFLFTRGHPGVFAWDLVKKPQAGSIDTDRYAELLCRAAFTLLQPLGVKEQTLRWWMFTNAGYGAPPGFLPELRSQETPLLEDPGWLSRGIEPILPIRQCPIRVDPGQSP